LTDFAIESTAALPSAPGKILPEHFESIVREHQKRIYRILFMLLRDPDEADCLTQECFLRAFARRAGFRGEAALGTWMIRIAINLARDHLKNRRASFWRRFLRGKESAMQSMAGSFPTPEESLASREKLTAVWSAVERLPLQQRTAFVLRFGEDVPLHEIAGAMNLREGTVKAHIANATAAIRRALEQRLSPPAVFPQVSTGKRQVPATEDQRRGPDDL
jgi:RNA polymerase sigma-70 factor (ECF subfamily)